MTFYQIRTSIIPILLLSTAACIVAWQIRSGVDRGRTTRMADLIEDYSAGRITEQTARARLADSCTEQDLWRWLEHPTRPVRDSALLGLGLIGTSPSVERLNRSLRNRNRHTTQLAEHAVRRVRSRTGNPIVDALLDQAGKLAKDGDSSRALETLEQCARILPNHAEVYYRTGTLLLELDRWADAEKALTQALDGDPTHFDALLGRALSLIERGQFLRANLDCLRALEINPNMEEVRLLLRGR